VPSPSSQIQDALDVSIGDNETQRYSLDGKYVLIKTDNLCIATKKNEGVDYDVIFPPGLTTELSEEEAVLLMQTTDWQIEDPEL
jgi:hypothetical protein